MAWYRIGDKPLSEPLLTWFTDAYICGTRGRWVNLPCMPMCQPLSCWGYRSCSKIKYIEGNWRWRFARIYTTFWKHIFFWYRSISKGNSATRCILESKRVNGFRTRTWLSVDKGQRTKYGLALSPGPLFTKKTPSYGYRDSHYKPKTVSGL